MWQRSERRKIQLAQTRDSLIRWSNINWKRKEAAYRTISLITLHLGHWDDVAVQRLIALKNERAHAERATKGDGLVSFIGGFSVLGLAVSLAHIVGHTC